MFKKLVILVGVAAVLALVLAACGATPVPTPSGPQIVVVTATPQPTRDVSKEPVTLRFTVWTANETQLKLLNDIAAAYKALHPNVTVKIDSSVADDYTQKVMIQLAGGDAPDAGWMLETSAASWIKAGALLDLAPTLDVTANYDFADFSKQAVAFWTRDQKVYGVPFSTSPFFVKYNIDLFQAAGIPTPDQMIANKEWTWENFAKAAKTIREKGGKDVYGFLGAEGGAMYTGSLWTNTTMFVRGFGGEYWSDDFSTCMMNTPNTVQALEFVQKMVVTDKSAAPPGSVVSFNTGSVGMAFGQLSHLTVLRDAKFKWGIVPMPSGPGANQPIIGQAAISVFRASRNQAAAADWVAFLTNKENVTKMAAFWPPARISVLNTGVIAKNNPTVDAAQLNAAITDAIPKGKVVSSHPDFAKVDLAAHPFFDKIWTPGANVKDLMDQACKATANYFTK